MDSLVVSLSVGVALILLLVQKVPLGEKVCDCVLLTLVLTVRELVGQEVELRVPLTELDKQRVAVIVRDCVGDMLRVTPRVRVRDPEEEVDADREPEGVPVKHSVADGDPELDKHSVTEEESLGLKVGDVLPLGLKVGDSDKDVDLVSEGHPVVLREGEVEGDPEAEGVFADSGDTNNTNKINKILNRCIGSAG